MWWSISAAVAVALGGCAQIFGLEATTGSSDAGADAQNLPDAQACVGGDGRSVDPETGHCYVFFATSMTRDAARSTCAGLGATTRLASIQSVSESAVITSLIGLNDTLIGGSDEVTEGTFVWDDGSPILLANWNPGEPNNAVGQFEEDCIVVLGSRSGLWNDVPCAPPPVPSALGMYPFVCERN
jgi:hypothetical protein